ncbi:hypothetical protein [Microcoleus sp. N9_A1]|uniref:hypothetical protein n=1 Tax=Microcoleus sp. N9_A1 TaxID=3055380 RepID=UPI002FD10D5C
MLLPAFIAAKKNTALFWCRAKWQRLNGFLILPYRHKALTFSSYTNLVFLNQHSMELLLDRILDRFMNDLRSL